MNTDSVLGLKEVIRIRTGETGGVAQTVLPNGSLTLTGALGQLLTLQPSSSPTAWQLHLDPTASQNVSYVSVSYSDAGAFGTWQEINASNGTNTDGGNNTNWNFFLDSTGFIDEY